MSQDIPLRTEEAGQPPAFGILILGFRAWLQQPRANALCVLSAASLWAGCVAAAAAENPPPAKNPAPPPDRQELWVPANRLKEILKKNPNAVMLSREEYETLLRDASWDVKTKPVAPRRAALSSARYQARVVEKTVLISATLTVHVLSDEWAEVPLDFGGVALAGMQVDGEAALTPSGPAVEGQDPLKGALLLRGRGERVITLELAARLTDDGGLNQLRCRLPAAGASSFELTLPPRLKIGSPQPIRITNSAEATLVAVGITPANCHLELNWRNAGAGDRALEPLVGVNGTYTVDAERLRGEFGFFVETQLGDLASAFELTLPGQVKVSEVTGDHVAAWESADGQLRIDLQPGQRSATKFWVAFDAPSLGGQAAADLPLPIPKFTGLQRMKGVLSLVGDAGVIVKGVKTDATLQPTDRAVDAVSQFVTSYEFNSAPTPPTVAVEKANVRFSADLDTRVKFQADAIFIERTVTLHQERGDVFQLVLSVPPGEELLRVTDKSGAEPDWRVEGGQLRVRWSHQLADHAPVFRIQTRIEPEKWTQLAAAGITFILGDLKIDGVDKVAGYIALLAEEAFRLEATPSETLERRDGRTTPITGDYAWFRGQEFSLAVRVVKRPGEVLSSLIGYALPLEGFLDLHAQVNYQFLHSGARSVRIQVPEKLASHFYFDGPQIAERNLNGDVWTVVFQKELTGNYALKVSAQVPVEKVTGGQSAAGVTPVGDSQFQAAVPVITPLDVVRTSGVWAIEANTETEIQFTAKGMNELDSLLAPPMADYQPRHRVIGVFAWLGKDYSLALTGVRHASAAMLTTIADALELETVVSTSGLERNQAVFRLRTAGAQYLDVQLPENSRLLSLTVDRELVKPVGDHPEQVRVPLSARRDPSYVAAITLLYETLGGEWKRRGAYEARAPRLAREIPVLRSMWRLYLPEGFEYTGFASNLRVPSPEIERPLLLAPLSFYDEWRLNSVFDVYSRSGIADPAALDRQLSPRLAAEGRRRLAAVAEQQETVHQYFLEAQGLYDAGRYDLAKKRCEQILRIQPDHQETLQMVQTINRSASGMSQQASNDLPDGGLPLLNNESGGGERPATRTVQEKLDRIIIPKLELREATIREAIEILKKQSIELDADSPAGSKGVNIVLHLEGLGRLPVSRPEVAPSAPGIPGFDPIPTPPPAPLQDPSDLRITVSLTSIPLREALKYVTGLADLKFKVEPYVVTVVPLSVNTDVLVTKEWTIPPDLIPRLPTTGATADREATKSWLVGNGVTFNGQASAVYVTRTNRLIVRDTQENIDLIDKIIEANTRESEPVRTINDGMADQARSDSRLAERINRKLDRIIIPKLEFRETTLREAVDFLRKRSQELDIDSPAGEKGVNIVLKMEGAGLPATPAPASVLDFVSSAEARISVSLTNIPLREALKYVTGLANLKFKVEPYAVFIVPLSENVETLSTREWKVPRGLIPRGAGGTDADATATDATRGGTGNANRDSSKDWLIANGVTFNGRASAVYVERSSRLIVRNTEDQLDLIDTIVHAADQEPEPETMRGQDRGMAERIMSKLDRIIIPKLELHDATIREAIDSLRKRSRDLDVGSPIDERGINIILKIEEAEIPPPHLPPPVPGIPGLDPLPDVSPAAQQAFANAAAVRISISMTNISLREALKYVTALANLKFKVGPYAVAIVPLSENTDALITREWRIPQDFIPRTPGGAASAGVQEGGTAVADRESSKNWLTANGVAFNGRASAVYIARSGRIIVRNTQDQLDLIDTIITQGGSGTSPSPGSRNPPRSKTRETEPARVVGALPMKLDLPKVGRMVEFEGFEAAEKIDFQYDDWWSRSRRLWLWFVGAGMLALAFAGARPWWRSCWAGLVLTFVPYCVSMTMSPVCNALLAGWLVSVILQRLAVRLVFAPRRKEVLA